MKFTLTIELGNEAMQTTEDIIEALHCSATSVRNTLGWGANLSPHAAYIEGSRENVIRDGNGNTVGKWEVQP